MKRVLKKEAEMVRMVPPRTALCRWMLRRLHLWKKILEAEEMLS